MNDIPSTGGRWQRDPETGALTKADAAPVPFPAPEFAPAPLLLRPQSEKKDKE